jgi:hypothetical protein
MTEVIDQNAGVKLGVAGAPQLYRCQVKTSIGAVTVVDVEADTGDAAALAALQQFPGGFVANVTPAPQQAKKAA